MDALDGVGPPVFNSLEFCGFRCARLDPGPPRLGFNYVVEALDSGSTGQERLED